MASVDSFAWIEFLAGLEKEGRVREILAGSEAVVTSDVVLAEVARKLFRDGVSRSVVRRKLADISTLSRMTPISIEVTVGVHEADLELRTNAKLRGLSSPGLSDAVILTTARILHRKVLTGDPHFYGLPETAWLGS